MKTVAAYSIKGGVGKTALAVNLAYACSARKKRVLLIDLDPQGAASFYFRVRAPSKLKGKKLFKSKQKLFSSIRESDYDQLDVLPSKLSFRNLDVILKGMSKSRKQLGGLLDTLSDEYDVAVLDCPPNITLLSENVFAASDMLLVPVVPTTLSERTYEQLLGFLETSGGERSRVRPFFSMVERRKKLHRLTMASMRERFAEFLGTSIPYSTDVERMGVSCEPLLVRGGRGKAARAFQGLADEILAVLADGKGEAVAL